MKRLENWPERLHWALMSRVECPFGWGNADCLLTAAALIEAMTGEDLAAPYRGRYDSELGAMRVIKEAGCDTVESFLAQVAGQYSFAEVKPLLAQRGDLVLFEVKHGTAIGIVDLNGRDATCSGPDGLRRLPLGEAKRAWRVG